MTQWLNSSIHSSLNKEEAMAEFDTIIKDGMIVDGTLVPPYHADLGIKDGKIAKIGRLQSSDAKQVRDASGLIVAPGAGDVHAHSEAPTDRQPYSRLGRRSAR